MTSKRLDKGDDEAERWSARERRTSSSSPLSSDEANERQYCLQETGQKKRERRTGKAESRRSEAAGKRDVAAGDGEVGNHFAERHHDGVAQGTDGHVAACGRGRVSQPTRRRRRHWEGVARTRLDAPDEQTGRSSMTQRASSAQEETRADDTADGNCAERKRRTGRGASGDGPGWVG